MPLTIFNKLSVSPIHPTILGWVSRRVVSAYDVVNASYLPTTINIYDLEIRSINNYRKSYNIASFLVSRPLRQFLVDADSVIRNLVNIYDPRMCVVTAFTIIIGYLQTFPPTIIADFSREWPTIYDNH